VSCTNSRESDTAAAADVLTHSKIGPIVEFYIKPPEIAKDPTKVYTKDDKCGAGWMDGELMVSKELNVNMKVPERVVGGVISRWRVQGTKCWSAGI